VRGKNRNPLILLLLIVVGLVIGGVIGDVFRDTIKWLGLSRPIGFNPVTIDLNIIQFTIGFMMKINLASAIGLIISMFIFTRM